MALNTGIQFGIFLLLVFWLWYIKWRKEYEMSNIFTSPNLQPSCGLMDLGICGHDRSLQCPSFIALSYHWPNVLQVNAKSSAGTGLIFHWKNPLWQKYLPPLGSSNGGQNSLAQSILFGWIFFAPWEGGGYRGHYYRGHGPLHNSKVLRSSTAAKGTSFWDRNVFFFCYDALSLFCSLLLQSVFFGTENACFEKFPPRGFLTPFISLDSVGGVALQPPWFGPRYGHPEPFFSATNSQPCAVPSSRGQLEWSWGQPSEPGWVEKWANE